MVEQNLPRVRPGIIVGLSVSNSDDLAFHGVTETHVRMALAEIARAVLIADGHLIYGGHLDEDGYTAFLVREIERSSRRNRPFTGYVPHFVHSRMDAETIKARIDAIGVLGSYRFLDVDGTEIDPLQPGVTPGSEMGASDADGRGLSAARKVIASTVDGQIVLGGHRKGYAGRMPGVVEETIYAIQAGKPIFIAGGFGGSAADMAVTLGVDNQNWLGVNSQPAAHLDELRDIASRSGWRATDNGLTGEENQRLAITYRASEIASLVVTGMSRMGPSQ